MAEIAVIVPARNAGETLDACLSALEVACGGHEAEIIVVDDASTDDTAGIAGRHDCTLIQQARQQGAAAARNRGAQATGAAILAFVDADVVVAPDAIAGLLRHLDREDVAAVFGAYDTSPVAPGLTSQYRNLLHHFVHLTGTRRPATFWSGLGAIRRDVFEEVGRFDPDQDMMEDVELGLRLRRAGQAIALDPDIQGRHLKHWSLWSMIRTDTLHRAIPWARLLRRYGGSRDLNLSQSHRIAAAGAGLIAFALPLALVSGTAAVLTGGAGAALFLGANAAFLRFLAKLRGAGFALAATGPHLIHTWCAIAGFVWVTVVDGTRALLSPARPRQKRIGKERER